MRLKNRMSIVVFTAFFCSFILSSNEDIMKKEIVVQEEEKNAPLGESPAPPASDEKAVMKITVILDPLEKVEVFPEVYEEIESIPFRLGESFKKGDLLLKMKNQFYSSSVDKTVKAMEFASEDLKIKESLYKDKLISTLELLKAESDLKIAKNNVDEAERNYQATLILAPFDGKIGSIQVREYQRPIRQKSMMVIFNDQKIIAKFIIPAHLLNQFKIGQTILIYVEDLKKKYSAKLIRIGAEINPISYTVNLEAEIDNSDGSLIPGMASSLEIEE